MLSAERRLELAHERAYGNVTREEMAAGVITGVLSTCYNLIWEIKARPILPRSDEMKAWAEQMQEQCDELMSFANTQEKLEKTDPKNPYYTGE